MGVLYNKLFEKKSLEFYEQVTLSSSPEQISEPTAESHQVAPHQTGSTADVKDQPAASSPQQQTPLDTKNGKKLKKFPAQSDFQESVKENLKNVEKKINIPMKSNLRI